MTLLLLIALALIILALLTRGPALSRRPRRRIVETVYEGPTATETRGDPQLIDRRLTRRRRVY